MTIQQVSWIVESFEQDVAISNMTIATEKKASAISNQGHSQLTLPSASRKKCIIPFLDQVHQAQKHDLSRLTLLLHMVGKVPDGEVIKSNNQRGTWVKRIRHQHHLYWSPGINAPLLHQLHQHRPLFHDDAYRSPPVLHISAIGKSLMTTSDIIIVIIAPRAKPTRNNANCKHNDNVWGERHNHWPATHGKC